MKQVFLCAFLAVAFSSCLDSDDPDFAIYGGGYIIQKAYESGETIEYSYTPYVQISSPYYAITGCSCKYSNEKTVVDIPLSKYNIGFYVADLSMAPPFTSVPTGNYTISATAEGERSASNVFSILVSQALTGKLNSTITYNASSREVAVSFSEVGNASTYVVLIEDKRFPGLSIGLAKEYTKSALESSNWEAKFTLSETIVADLQGGSYNLVTYAINNDQSMWQKGAQVSL